MSVPLPVFVYRERDLLLSLRDYLMTRPIRPVVMDGPSLALPDLYPTMAGDVQQGGVRLVDLYDEEAVPCFPCIGLLLDSLDDVKPGYGGMRTFGYTVFIDAICRVNDTQNGVDRVATENQRLDLFADLRHLLLEDMCRNVPLSVWDPTTGLPTPVGQFTISRQPRPRLVNNPSKVKSCLAINGDFAVEVLLFGPG